MKNILFHSGQALVTNKETFPTKPTSCNCVTTTEKDTIEMSRYCPLHDEACYYKRKIKAYNQAVADFIRDCTPIVEEDQEKVGRLLRKTKMSWLDDKFPVDHTIYKVEGLELEEVKQQKGNADSYWEIFTGDEGDEIPSLFEYRRAFKIKEI